LRKEQVSQSNGFQGYQQHGYVSEQKEEKLSMPRATWVCYDRKLKAMSSPIALSPDKYDLFSYRMGISIFYELQIQGKHPILLLESTNNRSVLSLIEKARRLHAEGIIFVHFEDDNMKPEVVHFVETCNYPIVFTDYPITMPMVAANEDYGYRATYLATDYLIQSGHQKIAFIGCNSRLWYEQLRLEGFLSALAAGGIIDKGIIISKSAISIEMGRYAAYELVAQSKDFTAVVCSSDYYAIGALRAFREIGKRIPEDVSIIGLHNCGSAYADPPITTVSFPYSDKAREVVSILLKQISPERVATTAIDLIPTLIHRESTRSLR
jgi:DNA-binding LacI/PurR family transcriptional regulator